MDKKISVLTAILITSVVWMLVSLSYLTTIINKYEKDKCEIFEKSELDGYNGTRLGGYSCHVSADRTDVYFNPAGEDSHGEICLGCNKTEYHFICYDGAKDSCFLFEELERVRGGVYN